MKLGMSSFLKNRIIFRYSIILLVAVVAVVVAEYVPPHHNTLGV
jgi:hypothetical protein